MTLEELFVEEYKRLKDNNDELNNLYQRVKREAIGEHKSFLTLVKTIKALKPVIKVMDGRKYVYVSNYFIHEDNEIYKTLEQYAEIAPKEENKDA